VAHRLAGAGGRKPHRWTGTPRGRSVAEKNGDLPIYVIALGFEFDQASKPLLSGQLLHVRSLSAGLRRIAGKSSAWLAGCILIRGYLRSAKRTIAPSTWPFVTVASLAGAPRNPAWLLNREANPLVKLQVRSRHFAATARRALVEERAQLLPRLVAMYPAYEGYQKRTTHDISSRGRNTGLNDRNVPVRQLPPLPRTSHQARC
jgi:deazaflavin-dependent oxidoreductase (nitroreductase family)